MDSIANLDKKKFFDVFRQVEPDMDFVLRLRVEKLLRFVVDKPL
jgi:hypothetical protein